MLTFERTVGRWKSRFALYRFVLADRDDIGEGAIVIGKVRSEKPR